MSQPFVGQIIAVGFNFAPVGWALCNGATLSISEYDVLYNLIGTTYGGNGTTTFNLPNLCGRGAVGMGQGSGLSNYVLGQSGGSENVTLTSAQIGPHTHALMGATSVGASTPTTTAVLGTPAAENIYGTSGATTMLAGSSIGPAPGGGQPHENRQPFQTVNYIIALYGIYPSQP
jgi:microcystin-dependent protein